MNDDFEKMLEQNSHIMQIRSKIGDVCDGEKLGDIESAILIFLSNIYVVHLGYDDGMARSISFGIRMMDILDKLRKAEDDYKGKYKI